MKGITKVIVSIPIYNEISDLSLTGESFPVLFSVGGMLFHLHKCICGSHILTQWYRCMAYFCNV